MANVSAESPLGVTQRRPRKPTRTDCLRKGTEGYQSNASAARVHFLQAVQSLHTHPATHCVGLERLKLWAKQAAPYPVVAIGGISLERMPGVLACGVDGVAVVSAVTLAPDPQEAALRGLALFKAA